MLRDATDADLAPVRALLATGEAGPAYGARGNVRLASPDGRIEAALEIRAAPPDRARVELRTGAMFGLVEERVVLVAPGDGHVIVAERRADRLERWRFEDSPIAALGLWGGLPALQDLVAGRVPWPGAEAPRDLAARTRLAGRDAATIDLTGTGAEGELELEWHAGRLRKLAWSRAGKLQLEVRWDRWTPLPGGDRPRRLRLRAPVAGVAADLELERIDLPASWGAPDFEVGRNSGSGPGVQGG